MISNIYFFLKKIIYKFKKKKTNFNLYWKNLNKNLLPQKLVYITDLFLKSDSYNYVSNFWHFLNIKNFDQLINHNSINSENINSIKIDNESIKNYASTIALNYFTFLDTNENLIKNTYENVNETIIDYKINLFKKHKNLNSDQSYKYNTLLILLYENLKKFDEIKLLKLLNDKSFCGYTDPFIDINGTKITHDKINSLFEWHFIKKIPISFNVKENIILELGAGSGRVAETILTFNKNLKYVICDIPLALWISYCRLKEAFPEKKIKLCCDTNSKNEIEKALIENDILFIFPHQINLFEKKIFDIFLAIDCLHEMDKETISKYMDLADKYSKYIYFTVREKSKVPFSPIKNELSISGNNFFIKNSWKIEFKSKSIFPSDFYSICYKI